MKSLTLPLDDQLIENRDFKNISIDMSNLKFPCNIDQQIKASFIYIRNIDIDAKLDFSKCKYDIKEQFILLYLLGNINVYIPTLRDTIIDIITYKYLNNITPIGILTNNEINQFISNNKDLINELCTLVISLPVITVYQYTNSNANGAKDIVFDSNIENTDYNKINFNNFSYLTESELFISLFNIINDYNPKFYTNYFKRDNDLCISRINKNLPIMNLLNILFAPKDIQNTFIDNLNTILTSKEV